jgi:hypothetical protein
LFGSWEYKCSLGATNLSWNTFYRNFQRVSLIEEQLSFMSFLQAAKIRYYHGEYSLYASSMKAIFYGPQGFYGPNVWCDLMSNKSYLWLRAITRKGVFSKHMLRIIQFARPFSCYIKIFNIGANKCLNDTIM